MTLCLFCSCFLQTWIYPEHILLSKKVLLRLIDIKTIHITLKTVVLGVGCFSVSPDILWFKIKIWLLPSTVNSNKRFTRSCFQGSQVEFSSFLSPRSSIVDLGLAFWSSPFCSSSGDLYLIFSKCDMLWSMLTSLLSNHWKHVWTS